jgi:hypothetical protein
MMFAISYYTNVNHEEESAPVKFVYTEEDAIREVAQLNLEGVPEGCDYRYKEIQLQEKNNNPNIEDPLPYIERGERIPYIDENGLFNLYEPYTDENGVFHTPNQIEIRKYYEANTMDTNAELIETKSCPILHEKNNNPNIEDDYEDEYPLPYIERGERIPYIDENGLFNLYEPYTDENGVFHTPNQID